MSRVPKTLEKELCRITESSRRSAVPETSPSISTQRKCSACRTSSLGILLVYQCNRKINNPACQLASMLPRLAMKIHSARALVHRQCQMQIQRPRPIQTQTPAAKTCTTALIIGNPLSISVSKTARLTRDHHSLRFSATEDSKVW